MTALAFAIATAASVAGCSGELAHAGAQPSPTPSIYPILPEATEDPSAVPTDEASSAFVLVDGAVLPDPTVTPGDAYADVTAADICDLHYTQGVRQPRYNTKVLAFAQYGISIHERDAYQVDKLIPTSLGGSNAIENLWPQPYDAEAGAAEKDLLERQLRGLVCSNKLTLAAAQQAIATDWWAANGQYLGLPIDPGSDGPEPWQPPADSTDPYEVTNQGPCPTEGQVGYTEEKHIRFTCTVAGDGGLRWTKRY